jgi:hypothetical protein
MGAKYGNPAWDETFPYWGGLCTVGRLDEGTECNQ